jgi:hypothetical protein
MAEPRERRTELAEVLCRSAGLIDGLSERAAALAAGEDFVEDVADALVTVGVYRPDPDQPLGPVARLETLSSLPADPELVRALDLRRAESLSSLLQVRLARVYALVGQTEKAASCFRTVVARDEPLSLAVALEVAEAAAVGGRRAVALGAIDWLAECLLTRDDISEGPRSDDPVRGDPLEMGALLERAALVATKISADPRTVALARAAANLYERMGRDADARRCLGLSAEALHRLGQAKKALTAAKALREKARQGQAPEDEAKALQIVAARITAAGQAKEAVKLYVEAAELLAAAKSARAGDAWRLAAETLADMGQLERGRGLLGAAAKQAAEAGHARDALALRAEAAGLDMVMGQLGDALSEANALREAWAELEPSDPAAAIVQGRARALIGDVDGAREALASCALDVDDWRTAGAASRIRAEVALSEGRGDEARMLLADAARAFLEAKAKADAAEALLRRAELSLDAHDPDACRLDLKRCRSKVGALGKDLELRGELLRARLCVDLDEREILLEEAQGRASEQGTLVDRSLAAAAKAEHHLQAGDGDLAREALAPVLKELVGVRDALPSELREGFRRSPLIKRLLELSADPSMA